MDSPLLAIAVLGVMFVTATLLTASPSRIDGLLDAAQGRYTTLEGLRGLLACCVLVHHALIAFHHHAGEPWASPASGLYHAAGDGAVAVFFMITGFLFWDKALAGRLGFIGLMRSRLRRILPLQVVTLALVAAVCMALEGRGGPVSFGDDLLGSLRWLVSGFADEPRINGVPTHEVDAGVNWSLTVEWLFYLSVVPLAFVCRGPWRFVGLVLAVLLLIVVARRTGHWVAYTRALRWLPFLAGMACAYFVRGRARGWRLDRPVVSAAIVLWVAMIVGCYHRIDTTLSNLALAPAFLAVLLGNDLFGLFRTRPMRWLGQIGFSIYLLHGVVLLGVLRIVDASRPIATLDPLAYTVLAAGIGGLMVAIASASYCLVERRFLDPWPSAAGWWLRLRLAVFAPAR